MRVWETRSLLAPKSPTSLHLTRADAEASVGTVNQHLFEHVEVERDVVFLLIHGGWSDEGGGGVLGVYATYEAAAAHVNRHSEDEVEIREVEKS